MRSRQLLLLFIVLFGAQQAAAQQVSRASVDVNVQFAPRTSLKVSSELLQFDVAQAGSASTATVEFVAGARMPSDGDVVLTVEPLHSVEGPGGAADVETALSVGGDGEGLQAARIESAGTTIVGRWHGSGLRSGRLIFTLRAGAPGVYAVPLRFVLSTP